MGNKSKGKPQVLTRAVRNKLFEDFLILTLAYFMELGAFAETDEEDRPKYTLNSKGEKIYITSVEKLQEAYNKLHEWLEAVNDHLIHINYVKQVVRDKLNEDIRVDVK